MPRSPPAPGPRISAAIFACDEHLGHEHLRGRLIGVFFHGFLQGLQGAGEITLPELRPPPQSAPADSCGCPAAVSVGVPGSPPDIGSAADLDISHEEAKIEKAEIAIM